MTVVEIFKRLALFSFFMGVALAIFHAFNWLGNYPSFAWLSLGGFTIVTALIISLASLAKKTQQKTTGIYVIMASMGIKFILSLLLIVSYYIVIKPESPTFVIPFLAFYFIYTPLTTYYILQLFSKKNTPVTPPLS